MKFTFELDEKESKALKAFEKKHGKKCWKDGMGVCGGGFEYKFVPTTIGCITIVKCAKCKTKEDITNYNNW